MNQSQISKRYYKEFGISMTAYVIVLVASVTVLNNIELPQIARVVVALLPSVPVVFIIAAIFRFLRESDELIQRIQLQAIVFSSVATGMITFSYGFLEIIGFPKLPTFLILPMMFMFWALSFGYFNRRYQ